MSQSGGYSPVLLSLDTPHAEFQLVAACDRVVLGVQSRTVTTNGRPHTQSAFADLSVCNARRLRDLIDEAVAATGRVEDPRRTSLWSNSTPAAVADKMCRERLA